MPTTVGPALAAVLGSLGVAEAVKNHLQTIPVRTTGIPKGVRERLSDHFGESMDLWDIESAPQSELLAAIGPDDAAGVRRVIEMEVRDFLKTRGMLAVVVPGRPEVEAAAMAAPVPDDVEAFFVCAPFLKSSTTDDERPRTDRYGRPVGMAPKTGKQPSRKFFPTQAQAEDHAERIIAEQAQPPGYKILIAKAVGMVEAAPPVPPPTIKRKLTVGELAVET